MRRWLGILLTSFLIACGAFLAVDEEPIAPASQTCVFDDPASKLDECKLAP
jgi:hypothetical protein